MSIWVKFLVCLQFFWLASGHHVRGNKPIIVCHIQLDSDINELLRTQLTKCDYIIVCDDPCDRSKPTYRIKDSGDKLSRLKDSAQHAKIMLSIPLSENPFEIRVDEGSERFCHEIEHCLNGELYDGIDLDFDPTTLDLAGQINYAQFLKKLRSRLNPSVIISTTVGAQRIKPSPLINAITEAVDFIVTWRDETLSINDHDEEFVLRKYTDAEIDSMLDVGFQPKKIVLGLKTAGIVTSPLDEKETHFKKCAKIGLIPYGQVCELRDQSKRFCSWRNDRRCLIFNGNSKVTYDNSGMAKERALQCTKRGLKGVSVLLKYDDESGICESVKFPLLNSIAKVFEKYDEDDECHLAEQVKGKQKQVEEDRLSNELTRLERAIENVERLTGLVQKMASFLLRALDKVIDLVISLTGKQNVDDPKKMDAELVSENSALNEKSDNVESSENVDSNLESVRQEASEFIKALDENSEHVESSENVQSNLESVRQEASEFIEANLPENIEEAKLIPEKNVVHKQIGNALANMGLR